MKPIIMSSTSVRAILDGNKTQTRRVVKPQPKRVKTVRFHPFPSRETSVIEDWKIPKARCAVGDRLWVRETWGLWSETWTDCGWEAEGLSGGKQPRKLPQSNSFERFFIAYKATGLDYELCDGERWYPSIFMPKWAARIWLEVTGVRVERVQDLTKQDALAEGMQGCFPRIDFETLWDSINTKYPWADNPWVWIYEFKRSA